jgi:hypothetical protein
VQAGQEAGAICFHMPFVFGSLQYHGVFGSFALGPLEVATPTKLYLLLVHVILLDFCCFIARCFVVL